MQRRTVLTLVALAAGTSGVLAQTSGGSRERQPDLGDVAEGRYFGDVISDSKGSSKSDVTLTLTRSGLNRVRITSDYPRLPVVEVTLQRALDKIVQSRGDTVFLYDWSRKPAKLDVSFGNEVSWSGTKQ
jgi:hypothetical protein